MLHYAASGTPTALDPFGDNGYVLVQCDTPMCGRAEKCSLLGPAEHHDMQELIFDYFRGRGWKIAIDPVGWDIRCSEHSMAPDLKLALQQRLASSPGSMFQAKDFSAFPYREALTKQNSASSGFEKALLQQKQWVDTSVAVEKSHYTLEVLKRLVPYLPIHADEPPPSSPKPPPPPASAGRPVFKPKELTEAEKLRPFMLKGPGQGMVRPGLTNTDLQLRKALSERAESVQR